MIRLYFYVEGPTEKGFVDKVLAPHLAQFGVMVPDAALMRSGRRHGVIYRGGGDSYAKARNGLVSLVKQFRSADVRFTTMIDFYAIATDFPGMRETEQLKHLPYERVRRLEDAFAADIGDPRLIPHLQLHEFETYLLTQPEVFKYLYSNAEQGIAQLNDAVRDAQDNPELVNDSPMTAPSKRIDNAFPGYKDRKRTDGVELATAIDLSHARKRCRHFDEWLTKLESLMGLSECQT